MRTSSTRLRVAILAALALGGVGLSLSPAAAAPVQITAGHANAQPNALHFNSAIPASFNDIGPLWTNMRPNTPRCAEDPGFSTAHVQLDSWTCKSGSAATNQYWESQYDGVINGSAITFELRNRFSKLCMAVAGGSQSNGAAVIQYPCDKNDHSRLWTEYYDNGSAVVYKNFHSGRCLNVSGNDITPGAKLIQYTCSTAANEVFYVGA